MTTPKMPLEKWTAARTDCPRGRTVHHLADERTGDLLALRQLLAGGNSQPKTEGRAGAKLVQTDQEMISPKNENLHAVAIVGMAGRCLEARLRMTISANRKGAGKNNAERQT